VRQFVIFVRNWCRAFWPPESSKSAFFLYFTEQSSHTGLVDVQLNSAIILISGTLMFYSSLAFSLQKYDSVTLLLQELHWQKVEQRIEYKLAVFVYRCLRGLAPPYLANDLRRVADLGSRRRLRSASTYALVVPPSRLSTVGDCAFPVAVARVWNSLPEFVTVSTSLPMFKRYLKTVLFTKSY